VEFSFIIRRRPQKKRLENSFSSLKIVCERVKRNYFFFAVFFLAAFFFAAAFLTATNTHPLSLPHSISKSA
jgi:hypothetical protein